MFNFIGAFIQSILALFGLAHLNTAALPPVPENNVQVVQQTNTPTTNAARGQNSLTASPRAGSMVVDGPSFNVTFYIDSTAIDKAIDFGDGNMVGIAGKYCTGTKCVVDHSYLSPGMYTAKLVSGATCDSNATGPSSGYTQGNHCTVPSSAQVLTATTVSITLESQSSISVSGMSKYTDTDFGFSFWYPSGWANSIDEAPMPGSQQEEKWRSAAVIEYGPNATILKGIRNSEVLMDEVYSSDNTILTSADTGRGDGPRSTYFFDSSKNEWLVVRRTYVSDATSTTTAAAPYTTMGGFRVFPRNQSSTVMSVVVPLAKNHFLVVYSSCDSTIRDCHAANKKFVAVVKTITATDPSVATPVSAAQQQATIQAERDAYAGQ